MAKAEDKRLSLPQLLRHVDQFASGDAKKYADNANPQRTKNKKKIFEVEEEVDSDCDEVVKEVKKSKKCNYCKRKGHVVNDCYKKRDDIAKSNNGSSNGSSSSSNKNGKGKANAKTNSRSFADQERARILEYVNRAFSLFAEGGEEAASAIRNKDF